MPGRRRGRRQKSEDERKDSDSSGGGDRFRGESKELSEEEEEDPYFAGLGETEQNDHTNNDEDIIRNRQRLAKLNDSKTLSVEWKRNTYIVPPGRHPDRGFGTTTSRSGQLYLDSSSSLNVSASQLPIAVHELLVAAYENDVERIEILLGSGDVRALDCDNDGRTALHMAAHRRCEASTDAIFTHVLQQLCKEYDHGVRRYVTLMMTISNP